MTLEGLGNQDSFGTCCDDVELFEVFSNNLQVAVAGQCVCQANAYNASGTCTLCTDVDPFCSTCQVTSGNYQCSTCSGGYTRAPGCFQCGTAGSCPAGACDAANNWAFSLGSCTCVIGFFNNTNTCLPCSSSIPNCLTCSNAGSLVCNSCSVGLFADGAQCSSCSLVHPACSVCSSSTACTTCEGAGPKWVQVGGACVCASGYYEVSNTCQLCSLAVANCLQCSGSGSPTCNLCQGGFYLDLNSCQSCSNVHSACSTCNDGTQCTTCTGANWVLANNTCECAPGFY